MISVLPEQGKSRRRSRQIAGKKQGKRESASICSSNPTKIARRSRAPVGRSLRVFGPFWCGHRLGPMVH